MTLPYFLKYPHLLPYGPACPGRTDPPILSTGVYLIVTPTEDPDALYRGCRVFKFSDLDTATLESTAGVPTVIASINGSTADKFNGACAFVGGSASGVLHSELSHLPDGEFQIFMTRLTF